MDHDDELLWEDIVRPSRNIERGPIPEFLAKKRAEQAVKTSLSYQTALTRFRDYLGADAVVGDIDDAAGHRFLTHLKSEGLSENAIATYFKCLKAFTRWLHKKGWTERDRFEDVRRPRFVRPKFDTLSVEQKQAILSACNPETFLGARNLAIICVFLETGIRLEELVHLEEDRVNFSCLYVEVFSRKTGDWRVIPLSDETVAVCHNYLKWRSRLLAKPIRHRKSEGDVNHRNLSQRTLSATTFFCSWKGEALTENSVGLMIRRLRQRLAESGMTIPIHPHLFRHNFLTEKALDGENPSMVRRWAGHRSYEMTDYYFGIAESKMAAIKPKQSILSGLSILPKKSGRPKRHSVSEIPQVHSDDNPSRLSG